MLDQLDDVGKGTYTTWDAFLYTVMLMPRRFIQIAPFIALLGTVGALGALAVNLELVAMRVAGLSPLMIGLAPVGIGGLLIASTIALEYFVAPQFQQQATILRAVALEQGLNWVRGSVSGHETSGIYCVLVRCCIKGVLRISKSSILMERDP